MRTALIMTALWAGMAQADVSVEFREGAPKDRFTITNTADCATGPVAITLDLIDTPAGLIFDVSGEGAGVEVFQPFEISTGAELVQGVSDVADGDQILTLQLSDLQPKDEVSFTIDLDDTTGGREITVNGSEIMGAMVMISTDTALAEGAFDETATANVILASCLS